MPGVVAAGHPLSAAAGAGALRAGGNAVDAALAAVLTSFAAEPLLSGLGAGGYMLVVPPPAAHVEPVVLDFFVEVPGRGLADGARRASLIPVDVSFGDAEQVFHAGAASVGTWGMPAGIAEASRRFGRLALAELVAPAALLAREGVSLNAAQAYIVEILHGLVTLTPECGAIFSAPDGEPLREGGIVRQPALAETMELLADEGAAPFYRGSVAVSAVGALSELGGLVTLDDLAAYQVVDREPVRVRYRGRDVLTNPPPSAGGTLIAYALSLLERGGRVDPPALVAAMDAMQAERTGEFVAGLAEPGFADRFLAGRLGSTTHVAVIDADGGACSVTSSNGEGAGLLAPGTGIHLNNMLGEQDLNPLGFHRFPPGRRLPSMMAPTAVLRDGRAELVLGSAGSNRIRSAILQTVVNVVDRGMGVEEAVRAPRLHAEDGVVYVEPGVDAAGLEAGGHALAHFRARNLFFGGVQAVARVPASGAFAGAGDPRRGGAAVVA